MPYVFPSISEETQCSILFVPLYLLPMLGALFSQMEKRVRWQSDSDWEQGYKAFAELQDQLMNNCVETLVQEIRALRGIKPAYIDVPQEDRTIDMYNDVNDVLESLLSIIVVLRGTDAITDSIIMALRGEVNSSATRNVADLLT